MMIRKITVLFLALMLIGFTHKSHAQRGKSEIALGYGYYSLYSFINKGQNYGVGYSTSGGTFAGTYRYYVTKDITAGFCIAYEYQHVGQLPYIRS
jgi:hypothetical protein